MRSTSFFHVLVPNIYGTIHLFDNIPEGDIKGFVFQHNSDLLVQLSIF